MNWLQNKMERNGNGYSGLNVKIEARDEWKNSLNECLNIRFTAKYKKN